MVTNMKYIIDLDAFKDCLDLLHYIRLNGEPMVYVKNVKEFIDNFPKEKYKENWEIEQETREIEQKGREAGLKAWDMIHQKRSKIEQQKVHPLTSKIDTDTTYNPLTSKL